jgi:Leucine-rich repeat (LRR) protein
MPNKENETALSHLPVVVVFRHDDELFCDVTCPASCTYYGHAFICPRPFSNQDFPQLRYLDASHSGTGLSHLRHNSFLVYLRIAHCGLSYLDDVSLPNLRHLDVSNNLIRMVSPSQLSLLPSLHELVLAGNPLISDIFAADNTNNTLESLRSLDLSRVALTQFSVQSLALFHKLTHLNLSSSGLVSVRGAFSSVLPHLSSVDLRGCTLTDFSPLLLQGLSSLSAVFADTYKLCCVDALPSGFDTRQCLAPFDEISSCDSLAVAR